MYLELAHCLLYVAIFHVSHNMRHILAYTVKPLLSPLSYTSVVNLEMFVLMALAIFTFCEAVRVTIKESSR